ncbi:MAG: FAD-dependent oxidoreductase [Armatimonadetes bacterium]|nr:FAD-dependent oxidoreductase [Armatimonadota bacterium]
MRVGIIGAGVAGLAAGRTLKALGHEAVLFEAMSHAGGRLASRAVDGYIFDTGPSSIAPRGTALEQAIRHELSTSGLHRIQRPIFVHTGLRVVSGDPVKNAVERFAYVEGNQVLADRLAEGLDLRLSVEVPELAKNHVGYECAGEDFDALILTPPAPIAKPLLLTVGEGRHLANTSYRPCLSVLLGFEEDLPPLSYHAILDPEQRHPLTWLCIESEKCPGRAPEGCTAMVAQLSPEFSKRHFETEDETVVSATLDFVSRLFGPGFGSCAVSGVVRWRYSQPETTSVFESANVPGNRVVVAGDGVMGSRLELAYESGVKAAHWLVGGSE